MVRGGVWSRRATAMGCLLLITFLVPSGAGHGGPGEDCLPTDGDGSDTSKDAGPAPETSRDLYDVCYGHLVPGDDEVDLMRDPLPRAPVSELLYHIEHSGAEYGHGYVVSTLGFRLLWIVDDQVEVLDEATLEEGEEHALWGRVPYSSPEDAAQGRAFVEITLIATDHTDVLGWVVHRHVAA